MAKNLKLKERTALREQTVTADGATYVYTLFSKPGSRVADYGLTLYSVEIRMTDRDGRYTESALEDIFSDHKKAFRFFDKLVKNLATPIDLPYILEDEIG